MEIISVEILILLFFLGNWKIQPLGTEGAILEDDGLVLPVSKKNRKPLPLSVHTYLSSFCRKLPNIMQ